MKEITSDVSLSLEEKYQRKQYHAHFASQVVRRCISNRLFQFGIPRNWKLDRLFLWSQTWRNSFPTMFVRVHSWSCKLDHAQVRIDFIVVGSLTSCWIAVFLRHRGSSKWRNGNATRRSCVRLARFAVEVRPAGSFCSGGASGWLVSKLAEYLTSRYLVSDYYSCYSAMINLQRS